MIRLDQFKVLSFDCYGTLIDWEGGIVAALAPLVARISGVPRGISRQLLLQAFARHEALQEHETPGLRYLEVLGRVYLRLALEWGIAAGDGEAAKFGASVGDWQPFADTVEALQYLKQHYRLVVLSNVDRQSFAATSRHLGVVFDAVYTAQDIGSYKPSLQNFRYLVEHVASQFDCPRHQLLHVAQSLYHDHVPANQVALASAWIDRRHASSGPGATPIVDPPPRYDFYFESLAALAEAHRARSL